MDDFSYLSVLISIVLGLGIANLLGGLATLVRRRAHAEIYWPVPVWIVTLFLIHVQTWWSMFGMRHIPTWSISAFLIVLMQPVLLFLMSALIVPDPAPPVQEGGRAAYFRQTRWFFALLFIALCNSIAKDVVLGGQLPGIRNLSFHLVFMAFAVIGFAFKRDAVHKPLAPLALAALVGYIALLFADLR